MQDRKYYEDQFRNYPDVVTKNQLMDMLGGICEKTAQSLLQKNKVQNFKIGNRYHIPKACVIDFLTSSDYIPFKKQMAKAHCAISPDEVERGKQKILFMCEQPQTRNDLMFMLDVSSKKTFFRLYLNPLLESGKLLMTIPDQRSVSTQKYVRAK